jgi:high-affinity iron transporter
LFVLIVFLTASPVIAQTTSGQDKAKQIWQLLDYLAVDYGAAVKDGKVASDSEYAEMQEFALSAERQLEELPANAAQKELQQQAVQLRSLIAKISGSNVSTKARGLAGALLAAYPVPVSPSKAPDLKLGAKLFQAQCASCHGSLGRGDGPLAASLNPPPIALTGHDRAKERSLFSLHQIITQGVKGTQCLPLPNCPTMSVGLFASNLPYSESDREAGKKLWTADTSLHASVPSLSILSQTSEATLAKTLPDGQAGRNGILKSNPQILSKTSSTAWHCQNHA